MSHRSWRVTSTDYVKVIRLRSWWQTWMTPHIWENPEGPKIHVGFVFFCELSLSKDLIEQLFCRLLSTCANRQRTSWTKGMQQIILLSTKGNSKHYSTQLSISGKRSTFLIETFRRLYLRRHSSPTSLKLLPIYIRSWRLKED